MRVAQIFRRDDLQQIRPRPAPASCRAPARAGCRCRKICVSTAMVGWPNAMLSTTLAVLRPTPGSLTSWSRSSGTSPPWSRISASRQRDDVLRLVAPQADGADIVADLLLAERQHLLRRVGDREQRPRRLVDADVGRLRRQHHGDQQGEGVDDARARPSAPAAAPKSGGRSRAPRPACRASTARTGRGRGLTPAPLRLARKCRIFRLGVFHRPSIIWRHGRHKSPVGGRRTVLQGAADAAPFAWPHRLRDPDGRADVRLAGDRRALPRRKAPGRCSASSASTCCWSMSPSALNYRAARAREEVSVSRTALDIRKTAPSGRTDAASLQPVLGALFGRPPRGDRHHQHAGRGAGQARSASAASSIPTTARVLPPRSRARWRPRKRG